MKWFGRFFYNDHDRAFIFLTWTHLLIVFNAHAILHEYHISIYFYDFFSLQTHQLTYFSSHTITQKQTFVILCIEFHHVFIQHHCVGNTSEHTHICNARSPPAPRFLGRKDVQWPRWLSVLCVNCIVHCFHLKWFIEVWAWSMFLIIFTMVQFICSTPLFCWGLYGMNVCFLMAWSIKICSNALEMNSPLLSDQNALILSDYVFTSGFNSLNIPKHFSSDFNA